MDEPAPTVWELHRGQTAIHVRLDQMVGTAVYVAQLAAIERRFAELERDLANLDSALKERAREEKEQAREVARERANIRRLVAAALLAAVAQFLVQVLAAGQGSGP